MFSMLPLGDEADGIGGNSPAVNKLERAGDLARRGLFLERDRQYAGALRYLLDGQNVHRSILYPIITFVNSFGETRFGNFCQLINCLLINRIYSDKIFI